MGVILHSRKPCCGGSCRLAPATAGAVLTRRCARCRVTWRVRLEPAHDHLRLATGQAELLAARWERAAKPAG